MSGVAQVIAGIATGIVSSVLLIFVFNIIFKRLDCKADKEETDRRFREGGKRFTEIIEGLRVSSDRQNEILVAIGKMEACMSAFLNTYGKKLPKGGDNG